MAIKRMITAAALGWVAKKFFGSDTEEPGARARTATPVPAQPAAGEKPTKKA